MNFEYMNHTQNNPNMPMGDFTGCGMMPMEPSSVSLPSAPPMPSVHTEPFQIAGTMPPLTIPMPTAMPMPIPKTYAKSPVMGPNSGMAFDGGISRQGPPPVMSPEYIPGFLVGNIGKLVRAEFVIGTTQYLDKTGILIEVGVNFFVLQDVASQTRIMCDLYSVRFVNILN